MFELSIAKKYLAPRWKQLSVSIISLISILVISLVVWLIVVFFSVTNGLEKGWVEKLTALTAPVRITPTSDYENSYYYLVDSISESSNYSAKSVGEKLVALSTDPYNPDLDEEIPSYFPQPFLNADGTLKDLVKEADFIIKNLNIKETLDVQPYEAAMVNLQVKLLRGRQESLISQSIYLASLDKKNDSLNKTLLPLKIEDIQQFFQMPLKSQEFQAALKSFFKEIKIEELKPVTPRWAIPKEIWPTSKTFEVLKVTHANLSEELLLTKEVSFLPPLKKQYEEGGFKVEMAEIELLDGHIFFKKEPLNAILKMALPFPFKADLSEKSLVDAKEVADLQFFVSFNMQGAPFTGTIPYKDLTIATVKELPKALFLEGLEPLLLPKTFKDVGALAFDTLTISFYSPTMSALQSQEIPAYVAGFYDPGLIPLGGKLALASPALVSEIRSSEGSVGASSGLNVRFQNLKKSEAIKKSIELEFQKAGIAPYFKVETYREYEFAKDILEQLESDKTLFSLISAIIIIVACSNIISMLIIMVNDKKTEIGILRSMGASSFSIALIFGISGISMGLLGSAIGMIAAYFTLKNIDFLILVLNKLQGHNAFNPMFYGDALPNEISQEALLFVMGCTVFISLIAALVPAFKAALLRPAAILKSE